MTKSPFLLCILDGVGLAPEGPGNAVKLAHTPVLDGLFAKYPHSQLRTDGGYVGLPDGQMGNSEVGHITLGSGRIIRQSLDRVTHDLQHGLFEKLPGYQKFIADSKDARAFHLVGLMSDGGVHGHINHALGLCRLLDKLGKPVFVHAIADGRDVEMKSGITQVAQFVEDIRDLKNVHLATINGRYYAMDRDNRWDRVEAAWRLMTEAQGTTFMTVQDAFQATYDAGQYDEFVPPAVIQSPLDGRILDGDAVLLFNFRADRMRQLARCFLGLEVGFKHGVPKLKALATMTSYDETYVGADVIYPPEAHHGTLGETVARAGLTQLRIAETEKYPHVTYYLNAGREDAYQDEDRILVASPKEVKSYDLKPEMSLPEVSDKLVAAILSRKYDFIALNIANGDLVGHTGSIPAVIAAVEAIDHALGNIIAAIQETGGAALVIADHGNAEEMIVDNRPSTSHSTNPVPCIYVGEKFTAIRNGGLADIAPTILKVMGLAIPAEMTGQPLL
jgi:2,3-bisphosphoglycerate-independent phosphoglycerate mutase